MIYIITLLEKTGLNLTPTDDMWRALDYDREKRTILFPESTDNRKRELVVNGAIKPLDKPQVDIYKLTVIENGEYDGEQFKRLRAVALCGKDETGQYWLHHLPLFYANASILACERWLLDMRKEDMLTEST